MFRFLRWERVRRWTDDDIDTFPEPSAPPIDESFFREDEEGEEKEEKRLGRGRPHVSRYHSDLLVAIEAVTFVTSCYYAWHFSEATGHVSWGATHVAYILLLLVPSYHTLVSIVRIARYPPYRWLNDRASYTCARVSLMTAKAFLMLAITRVEQMARNPGILGSVVLAMSVPTMSAGLILAFRVGSPTRWASRPLPSPPNPSSSSPLKPKTPPPPPREMVSLSEATLPSPSPLRSSPSSTSSSSSFTHFVSAAMSIGALTCLHLAGVLLSPRYRQTLALRNQEKPGDSRSFVAYDPSFVFCVCAHALMTLEMCNTNMNRIWNQAVSAAVREHTNSHDKEDDARAGNHGDGEHDYKHESYEMRSPGVSKLGGGEQEVIDGNCDDLHDGFDYQIGVPSPQSPSSAQDLKKRSRVHTADPRKTRTSYPAHYGSTNGGAQSPDNGGAEMGCLRSHMPCPLSWVPMLASAWFMLRWLMFDKVSEEKKCSQPLLFLFTKKCWRLRKVYYMHPPLLLLLGAAFVCLKTILAVATAYKPFFGVRISFPSHAYVLWPLWYMCVGYSFAKILGELAEKRNSLAESVFCAKIVGEDSSTSGGHGAGENHSCSAAAVILLAFEVMFAIGPAACFSRRFVTAVRDAAGVVWDESMR